MDDWRALLKDDPTEWLLEKNDPSVRYLALTRLLERSESDPDVKEAKEDIMRTGPVPLILSKQREGGFWEDEKRFYLAKYKGTVWQLIILAELGADGTDERIRKACEFILESSQDRESGGFAMSQSAKMGGGRHSEVIPCLTGNMVWSLIRLGYLGDPRVKRGIDWIARYQRFDDGIEKDPTGWPYDRMKICFGRHSCHMGVVKAMKALTEIPEEERSKGVKDTLEKRAEYILLHHVHKKSHDLDKVSKPGWLRFGFPLMYQTDVLEILLILTKLGYKDDRMREAFDKVVEKQDKDGRWKLENTIKGNFHMEIEKNGALSKWITLRALEVIKGYGRGH